MVNKGLKTMTFNGYPAILHWLYSTSLNFVAKLRHNNVKLTSVFFHDGGRKCRVFYGKTVFIEALAPKRMQENESNTSLRK